MNGQQWTPSRTSFHSTLVAVLLLTLVTAARIDASGRRRPVSSGPSPAALAITFVDAVGSTNAPMLDAGIIQWQPKRADVAVRRTVGMRIGAASIESNGMATVRAWIESDGDNQTVRLNGVTLTAAPQVIRRHTPIGVVTFHRLEIEVPRSAPEGPFATSIQWEVTAE